MELGTGAALGGKAILGLRGPVSRFIRGKRAAAAQDEVEELFDPSSAAARLLVRELRTVLAERAGVDDDMVVDIMRATRSPLMDAYLRMTVLEAISTRNDSVARELIVEGMGAVLTIEGVADPSLSRFAATSLEEKFYAEVSRRFRKLTARDAERASLVQASASAARFSIQPSSRESMGRRTSNLARLDPIDWADLTEKLRAYGAALVSDLSAFSIPTPTQEFQVGLDEAFVNSSLQQLAEPTPDRPLGEATNDLDETNPPALLQVIAECGNLVLFGDPGSGKSTHSRAAALHLAFDVQHGSVGTIPIRIDLRGFARGKDADTLPSLLDHSASEIASQYLVEFSMNELRALLHSGSAVVFLDGLDEILDVGVRRVVVKRLTGLFAAFPSCNYVVTSRFAGYEEAPVPASARFSYARTLPFSREEIAGFAEWFFDKHGLGGYRKRLGIGGFMQQTEPVHDIRSNPLMLGVLSGLYASGRTVPANRTDLYRDCARMLFEQWDQLKGTVVSLVDQEAAELAIRELAHEVLRSGREEVGLDDLEEFLVEIYERELDCGPVAALGKSRKTIETWRGRHWVLVFDGRREGRDWYRFSHRTFLEFFAAEHVAYEVEDGTELCARLRPYILQRSPLPYVHLAIQITSRRRALDGDLVVAELLNWVSDPDSEVLDRINSAITLSEVLPSIRTKTNRVRSEAVKDLLREVANWLPRMTDVRTFFEIPYAYADLRGLSPEESQISDAQYKGVETAIGGELTQDPGVDFIHISRMILGLDHGGAESNPVGPALQNACVALAAEMDVSKWIRLAHFVRACPQMESSVSVSPAWLSELDELGTELGTRITSTVRGLAPYGSNSTFDFDDRWALIMCLQIPGAIDPDLVRHLAPFEMFVGGWPYPMLSSGLAPTVAHRVVQSICSFDTSQRNAGREILRMLDLSEQPAFRDLFVDAMDCELNDVPDLPAEEVFRLAALCSRLQDLGDPIFVGKLVRLLSEEIPSHALLRELLPAVGYDDSEHWPAVLSSPHLAGVGDETLRSLLSTVCIDPGYVLEVNR